MYSSFSSYRLHSKFIYIWCYFQALNISLYILSLTATTSHHISLFMDQLHASCWFFFIISTQYQPNKHNSSVCMYPTFCGMLLCLSSKWIIFINMETSDTALKKHILLIYILHFLNKSNINQSTLQPVHSIQSHVLRCTLTCEDLWSPKMCLFPLHTSTPNQLTAVANTHTEHSQQPHVRVNSHTCRSTVLYYTVVPL